MRKLLKRPASRLICFGGAKACTNDACGPIPELDPEFGFDD